MSRSGRVDFSELEDFAKKVEKELGEEAIREFIESCAKELAARLLREVIQRTPVGDYSGEEYTCKVRKGEKRTHQSRKDEERCGGTLRKGWTVGEIRRNGDTYTVEIVNPVEYAPYVEYGHRTIRKNGFGWAEGHFMLTISSQEIQNAAPDILEKKLQKKLSEVFK